MIQIVELECSTCEEIIAHVQVVPGTLYIRGEAWCPGCFPDDATEDENSAEDEDE